MRKNTYGGRNNSNMSPRKRDEYGWLTIYADYDEIPVWCDFYSRYEKEVIMRFFKNLKRRKTWLRLYEENTSVTNS